MIAQERVVDAVRAVQGSRSVTPAELAELLEVNRRTADTLMVALEEYGVVGRPGNGGRRIVQIGALAHLGPLEARILRDSK